MGSLLGSGSVFIEYMILVHELEAERFGIFSSTLPTATVLSILAGFGVSQTWLKYFEKEGCQALRWLPSSFKLVSYSVIFVFVVLFSRAYFGPHDEVTKNIFLFSVFL